MRAGPATSREDSSAALQPRWESSIASESGASRRLALLLDYDGTDFVGWQVQANGRSIQGEIEAAVFALFGERRRVTASGRTDSGVHASGQVAHLDLEHPIPASSLPQALNSVLVPAIRVLDAAEVPKGFNSRRDAVMKRYSFLLADRRPVSPLHRHFVCSIADRLDEEKIRLAAAAWIGEHDFTSFRGAGCDADSPVRTMKQIEVARVDIPPGRSAGILRISFESRSFLKHQVRNMVGTLVEFGSSRRSPEGALEILLSRSRSAAGPTSPPHGLILERVDYPRDIFSRSC